MFRALAEIRILDFIGQYWVIGVIVIGAFLILWLWVWWMSWAVEKGIRRFWEIRREENERDSDS